MSDVTLLVGDDELAAAAAAVQSLLSAALLYMLSTLFSIDITHCSR